MKMAVNISADDAFRALCFDLDMHCVLDEDGDYIVKRGKLYYKEKSGEYELYDERGALFVALRNVAVNMYPNAEYRSAPYIYDIEDEEDAT